MTASARYLFQQHQVLTELFRVRETCQDTWRRVRRGSPRLFSVRGGRPVLVPSASLAQLLELEPDRQLRLSRIANSHPQEPVEIE
jgi:hypothetical protein